MHDLLAQATAVLACPVCDGATGAQVRDGLFADGEMARNLLAIALPFVIVAGVAAMIHFGFPFRWSHRDGKRP